SNNIKNSMLIKGGNITIEELLKGDICYSGHRRSLKQRQLMFLEQLMSYNGKKLLHWQEITGNERRGPKPNWFKMIENKVLSPTSGRLIINNNIQSQLGYRFNTCMWNIDKSSKDIKWVAIKSTRNQVPIIGKKRKVLDTKEFIMEHYIRERNSEGVENSILKKCKGCTQGDNNLTTHFKNQEICLVKVSIMQSVNINVIKSKISCRITPDKSSKLRLRSEIEAIDEGLNSITESRQPIEPSLLQSLPSIQIDNYTNVRAEIYDQYRTFWCNNEIQDELDRVRTSLANSKKIDIYTDGSLKKAKDNEGQHSTEVPSMGCGWVASGEHGEFLTFNGKVENFVSSTRAELTAILTAVYATPKHSILTIYTDSKAAIDAWNGVLNNPKKAHRKYNNWTLLKAIKELITVQTIQLYMIKVKAHSGVTNNELTDKLAGEGHNRPSCTPRLQNLSLINAICCWNDLPIEEPLRKFTKKSCAARHFMNWRLLNRNTTTVSIIKSNRISWRINMGNIFMLVHRKPIYKQ
ncbi:MAG TPA: RNase H family protein, partial [Ignavibacteriaceae bacterium]